MFEGIVSLARFLSPDADAVGDHQETFAALWAWANWLNLLSLSQIIIPRAPYDYVEPGVTGDITICGQVLHLLSRKN